MMTSNGVVKGKPFNQRTFSERWKVVDIESLCVDCRGGRNKQGDEDDHSDLRTERSVATSLGGETPYRGETEEKGSFMYSRRTLRSTGRQKDVWHAPT